MDENDLPFTVSMKSTYVQLPTIQKISRQFELKWIKLQQTQL
jgi:hypothetical protein